MKVLSILSSGYRATLEEQDDTVVWISQSLRRAGADLDLLLRGSAANYVVTGQQVEPLNIGGRAQRNAPDVHAQVRELAASGAGIFVLEDDLQLYGLMDRSRLDQARIVRTEQLPALLSDYESIWHW